MRARPRCKETWVDSLATPFCSELGKYRSQVVSGLCAAFPWRRKRKPLCVLTLRVHPFASWAIAIAACEEAQKQQCRRAAGHGLEGKKGQAILWPTDRDRDGLGRTRKTSSAQKGERVRVSKTTYGVQVKGISKPSDAKQRARASLSKSTRERANVANEDLSMPLKRNSNSNGAHGRRRFTLTNLHFPPPASGPENAEACSKNTSA